jgi:hypothetical protein
MASETLVADYDEASSETWLRPDEWLSSGRIVTDEERQSSQERVDAILGQLPDDERRVVMWAWMNADKRRTVTTRALAPVPLLSRSACLGRPSSAS